MNNIIVSFVIMLIIILCGYLIGKFFDVGLQYFMPFLLWLLALCIFNMFLDKQHVNIYMKTIESSKDSTAKKDSIATRAMKAVRATMPTMPTMPTIPTIPKIPTIPTMPTMPKIPKIPTIPRRLTKTNQINQTNQTNQLNIIPTNTNQTNVTP
jgi:hypothetical protein